MIIDVTSKAQDEFVKFSPFYPIGGIPVPFTEGMVALSVEGIWQGLKVFEGYDIDTSLFSKRDMKNMKRTTRKYGPCLGHRKGVHGEELLGYLTARKQIYLPCYKWVLENKLQKLVTAIRIISKNKPVVLLDYNTNPDVNNPKSPLLFFCCYNCYDVGTNEYQCACYGFIPRQDILAQHNGYERSDDGLEIGVDRNRCGLEVFHRKGDEEIA